jgi:four helix bundle protein
MSHSHRDLTVWQNAMSLATDVYLAARLVQRDDRFVLGTQLQRSAISVPSNLAEGWARNQRRVLEAHVRIALGSGAELQTQLDWPAAWMRSGKMLAAASWQDRRKSGGCGAVS